jgi:hypothetical protein
MNHNQNPSQYDGNANNGISENLYGYQRKTKENASRAGLSPQTSFGTTPRRYDLEHRSLASIGKVPGANVGKQQYAGVAGGWVFDRFLQGCWYSSQTFRTK